MISFQYSKNYDVKPSLQEKAGDLLSKPMMVAFGRTFQVHPIRAIELNEVRSAREPTTRENNIFFLEKQYSAAKKVAAFVFSIVLFPFSLMGFFCLKRSDNQNIHLEIFQESNIQSRIERKEIRTKSLEPRVFLQREFANIEDLKKAFRAAEDIFTAQLSGDHKYLFSVLKKKVIPNIPEEEKIEGLNPFENFFAQKLNEGTCFGQLSHLFEMILNAPPNQKISDVWAYNSQKKERVFYFQFLEHLRSLFNFAKEDENLQEYKKLIFQPQWDRSPINSRLREISTHLGEMNGSITVENLARNLHRMIQGTKKEKLFGSIEVIKENEDGKKSVFHIFGFYLNMEKKEFLWADNRVFSSNNKEIFLLSLANHLKKKYCLQNMPLTLSLKFYQRKPEVLSAPSIPALEIVSPRSPFSSSQEEISSDL